MEENQNSIPQEKLEPRVDLREFIFYCLSRWYWFVISAVICLGIAVYRILSTAPTYQRSELVLISDYKSGNEFGNIDVLADMGLFRAQIAVNDEIKALDTYTNMEEVVKRLKLNVSYYGKGRFHDQVLYAGNLPVEVDFVESAPGSSFSMHVSDSGVELDNWKVKGDKVAKGTAVKMAYGDTLSTPVGVLCVNKSTFFDKARETFDGKFPEITVGLTSIHNATTAYSSRLKVSLVDKQSNVISLSIVDASTARAEDVLNTTVAVYKEKWVQNKNRMAQSASVFINERLAMIEEQLSGVDNEISAYKSSHRMPDVVVASRMYMQQSEEVEAQKQMLNNQLYMARYIKNYLSSDSTGELLPAGFGLQNNTVEKAISDYNTTLLKRNNIASTTSANNPLIQDMDENLSNLRQSILASVEYQILSIEKQIRSLEEKGRQTDSKIASSPSQERYLMNVERQQKVTEAIYLFLLEKREGTELSQAFTAYNTRVIDAPNGSNIPVAPRKSMILLVALMIGLCIPVGWFYVQEMLNTTIRGKKDLDALSVPFAGEIPFYGKFRRGLVRKMQRLRVKLGAKMSEEPITAVVRPHSRNVINEAYRILRTNLEFMCEPGGQKVLMVTSYNVGSGKSFISVNTSLAFGIKGHRVLAIDGDLRHASLSTYVSSPKTGLSDYLSGRCDDVHSLIVKDSKVDTVDFLPCGTIPPNPTELISTARFKNLVNAMRDEYDYILIDCPPADMLADAQIIEQSVDRTIFVVRAGLFEKVMMPEVEAAYREGKFKNMCLLLNGTECETGKYGRYGKYGHYGYHYGNYYGHYASDED